MTGENSISIIPMQLEHLDDVIQVHLESFAGYFLTFLGPRFLRVLFTEIIKEPDHVAFVAQDQLGMVGYVIGVTHQARFYSRLALRRQFAFAFASAHALVRDIKILPRLLRGMLYYRAAQKAASQALLMSIGVSPRSQQNGVGTQLVFAFLNAMKQRNIDKVSLLTDRDGNEKVNLFYQKIGFELCRQYVTAEGRWMNEYLIDMSNWSLSAKELEIKDINPNAYPDHWRSL